MSSDIACWISNCFSGINPADTRSENPVRIDRRQTVDVQNSASVAVGSFDLTHHWVSRKEKTGHNCDRFCLSGQLFKDQILFQLFNRNVAELNRVIMTGKSKRPLFVVFPRMWAVRHEVGNLAKIGIHDDVSV